MALKKNHIDNVLDKLIANFKSNPGLERTLKLELDKLVRKIYTGAINQNTGYCMTFKIPEIEILNLIDKCGLVQDEIKHAFSTDWKIPPHVHMANNPFYHILLLFVLYGLRYRNEAIAKTSLTLFLCRTWNGRRQKYIPHCKPDTMRYVIANLHGKYLVTKHDNPMAMIMNHFIPTLFKKYGDQLKRDSYVTKRLFDQCWSRIRQLFVSSPRININTGANENMAGLSPLYFKATESGLKISTPRTTADLGNDDNDGSSLEHYTSHTYDQMISSITNHIIMNFQPNYNPKVINHLVHLVPSSKGSQVKILVDAIHSTRYEDFIRDILGLMFKLLQVSDKPIICSDQFYDLIRKKIVSSKHSPTVTQLKHIVDLLLEKIFKEKIQYTDYTQFSPPYRGKFRAIIIYAFGYNIQQFICNER